MPEPSVEVWRVATPPLRFLVPSNTPSALKVTDPDGVPVEVTLAVKVTLCPTADGFGDDVNDIDVVVRTFSVSVAEVLGA